MTARAAVVGRRLALGTWLQLEAWGRWLGAGSHVDRAGILRLGVLLRRVAVSVAAAAFYGALLQRAPGAIYAVPVVWAVGAWQMSDSSAPPPPGVEHPSCRECAGHEPVSVTSSETQKGMLIYSFALPDRPNHTHIHLAGEVNSE